MPIGRILAALLLGAGLALPPVAATSARAQSPALSAAPEVPLPPRRPADLRPASPAAPGATPVANRPLSLNPGAQPSAPGAQPSAPAARPAAPAAPGGQLSNQEAVQRVNDYLNSFRTLIADFVQFGADGRRYEGRLYLQRPGRMRFEYRAPATIEIVADGTTVAVRDRRLATQDNYLISQTPLKFLLRERINLASDVRITRVESTREQIRVSLEDRATFGGTSRITIHFDPVNDRLQQWVIIDPQGYETAVQVANLDTSRAPDPGLFRIEMQQDNTRSSGR